MVGAEVGSELGIANEGTEVGKLIVDVGISVIEELGGIVGVEVGLFIIVGKEVGIEFVGKLVGFCDASVS